MLARVLARLEFLPIQKNESKDADAFRMLIVAYKDATESTFIGGTK